MFQVRQVLSLVLATCRGRCTDDGAAVGVGEAKTQFNHMVLSPMAFLFSFHFVTETAFFPTDYFGFLDEAAVEGG